MRSKITSLMFVLGAIAFSDDLAAAEMLDVTFTVPVQIQNIRSNWSRVGVFCGGFIDNGPALAPGFLDSLQQVGIIDVSGKTRQSISQTVTGTIRVPDTSDAWACQLKLQRVGESSFTRSIQNASGAPPEFKPSQTFLRGKF